MTERLKREAFTENEENARKEGKEVKEETTTVESMDQLVRLGEDSSKKTSQKSEKMPPLTL